MRVNFSSSFHWATEKFLSPICCVFRSPQTTSELARLFFTANGSKQTYKSQLSGTRWHGGEILPVLCPFELGFGMSGGSLGGTETTPPPTLRILESCFINGSYNHLFMQLLPSEARADLLTASVGVCGSAWRSCRRGSSGRPA